LAGYRRLGGQETATLPLRGCFMKSSQNDQSQELRPSHPTDAARARPNRCKHHNIENPARTLWVTFGPGLFLAEIFRVLDHNLTFIASSIHSFLSVPNISKRRVKGSTENCSFFSPRPSPDNHDPHKSPDPRKRDRFPSNKERERNVKRRPVNYRGCLIIPRLSRNCFAPNVGDDLSPRIPTIIRGGTKAGFRANCKRIV
jgi:hypothetical protein